MVPLRASTTKSESLPDDPTAFVPSRPWNLPSITTWDDSRNQNHPTDSAEEAYVYRHAKNTWGRLHFVPHAQVCRTDRTERASISFSAIDRKSTRLNSSHLGIS